MRSPLITLNHRPIGSEYPCFVIAEAGVNHNGDLNLAKQLIQVAAAAGADAVKFQTFRADNLVTRDAPKAAYQVQNTGEANSQYKMLRQLELQPEDHLELIACCQAEGILFLSTPFDEASADLLASLDLAAFKVSSGDLTNLPFLEHLAAKGKPILLSTGMSYLWEVELAVQAIATAGPVDLALLHCVSNYPASPKAVNLRAMATLSQAFAVPVGYSDHTLGLEVALASVALGACILEKHITLDRTLPGPDHKASLEPHELTQLVQGIRHVEASLGTGLKQPTLQELDTAAVARKSLVAAEDLAAGTVLTPEMIAIKRPGTGLAPQLRSLLVNRTLKVAVSAGTLFAWDQLV